MGKLEKINRKTQKRENLQKIILQSVAAVGVLSVALVVPNVIGAMGKIGLIPKKRQKEYISSSTSKLIGRGLLKFEDSHYQLTQKGEKILRHWELLDFNLKRPKKWDKNWRIIIYDISEKKGAIRRKVLQIFKQAGFYPLQNSVWVYPYDCENIIGLLKTDLNIGKDILYIIAREIENDKYLREYFNLKT